MDDKIRQAIEIACKAHKDQVDKAGKAYILHPLRVMANFTHPEKAIVAILHDVLEDSEIKLEELPFTRKIKEAIECLTRKEHETYFDFIQRVSENPLARDVKIEDLKDNMDLSRLDTITDEDLKRVKKYHKALKYLEKKKHESFI